MSSSSRGKNFRRRSEEDTAAGEEKPVKTPIISQTLAHRQKPKTTKLLSFADDEEEEVGGPTPLNPSSKPSSSSSSSKPPSLHKHTAPKDRSFAPSPAPPSIPSNVQPQAGEYTKEKLRELQKNARSLSSSSSKTPHVPSSSSFEEQPNPPKSEHSKAEPVILLKGLVKPPVSSSFDRKEKEKETVQKPRQPNKEEELEDNEEEFAKLGINGNARDPSLIPDQATINAIRAKRERLRKSRAAAPDYISLDGGSVVGSARSGGGGSSDEEDDHEFRGRVSLVGDLKDSGIKNGVFDFESIEERVVVTTESSMVTDGGFERRVDDEEEEDEVERIWEEAQVRKGLGKRLDDSSSYRGTNGSLAVPPIQQELPVYLVPFSTGSFGASSGVTRSAEIMSISQQAEVANRALQENITRLKETHGRTLSSLVRADENLSESLSTITSLEKSLEAAGDKFVFMQELRNFISVTCDFLQDKAPFIEELEEHMQKLHEDRALSVAERRDADNTDEMRVEASVNAALSVLSKGSGSAYVSAALTAAQAASAVARESSNVPVQLDEFGRDLNLQNRMDSTRRADARKRRKARSESKRMTFIGRDNSYQHIEGESSTDESDTDSSAYQSSRDELLLTAEQIFSDAADEYSKLSVVKGRLENWKRHYYSSYRDAYMSLSAFDVFSPYVRLELLEWDPLYKDIDFFDMKWHSLLFDYGLRENESNFDPDDPDANLIPELVEKVALPILHHEIAHCWDLLSTQQTKHAVFAANLIINYIPPSSESLRDLLAVVRTRLAEAISNLNVPTWNTTVIKLVPDAAQLAAYRFGVSVRLLRNICLWKDIIAMPILEELALDELLRGMILPHLRSLMPNLQDAITRTERVIASLAGVWSGPNVSGEPGQKLQPLVECVVELGRKLEKRRASGMGEETQGLARRLKKMLIELNEYDKARDVLRTFQLKEAL